MSNLRAVACGAILALCPTSARATSTVTVATELEPNGTKLEATPIACLAHGSRIEGWTTGASTSPDDASIASADTFRVRVCPLPPGVYRHRLVLTTTGVDEFALSIRGLVVGGPSSSPSIDANSDTAVQVSIGGGSTHHVQWYGFGRQEELYVRVTGTASTLAPYALELETLALAETQLPVALRSGTIEFSTVGQGHNTDTEIFVLDADRAAIPGFRNDDAPGGGTKQSRLTRTFAPGSYTVAIARFNLADAELSGADDAYPLGPVLDFRDCLVSWSPSGSTDVSAAVVDALGSTPMPTQLAAEPYTLAWWRITVVDAPLPPTPVCFGDGTGAPCPCGNSGFLGRGCANSVNPAGGVLAAAGLANLSLDTFVLSGSGMPVSTALYFQGTSTLGGGNGVPFGDGLRCTGGAVLRLGSATNFGGGSVYPGIGGPPISVSGLIPPSGGERIYQLWYRNSDPTFCTAAFYNLTNAIQATWVP